MLTLWPHDIISHLDGSQFGRKHLLAHSLQLSLHIWFMDWHTMLLGLDFRWEWQVCHE